MAQSIERRCCNRQHLIGKKQWKLSVGYGRKCAAYRGEIRRAENRGTGSRSGK